MRIIEWKELLKSSKVFPPAAMTIGVFDGLHLGHKALIDSIVSNAEGFVPCVVTFSDNPKAQVRKQNYTGDILTLERKMELLAAASVLQVILIDFSGNFSKLSGKEFIDHLRNRGNLRYLAVGHDFRCGYRLDTDARLLEAMNRANGIRTDILEPVCVQGSAVSSSRIRTAIVDGDLVEAAALLGRNVEIDLAQVPMTPGAGGYVFHAGSAGRIMPPEGRYSVLLFRSNDNNIEEMTVEIQDSNLIIPSGHTDFRRIEFVT